MIMSLAFVHPNDVVKAFDEIVVYPFWHSEKEPFHADKQTLLNYFEANYIGVLGRSSTQQRKIPKFPINLWNMHALTLNRMFTIVFSLFF